jgi:hypothetical protein
MTVDRPGATDAGVADKSVICGFEDPPPALEPLHAASDAKRP